MKLLDPTRTPTQTLSPIGTQNTREDGEYFLYKPLHLTIGENGVLRAPTLTWLDLFCGFISNSLSFMKCVLVFCVYVYGTVESCWIFFSLMRGEHSSLPLLINFDLKSFFRN